MNIGEDSNTVLEHIRRVRITGLSLLLLLPFAITIILIVMFFILNSRLAEMEQTVKIVNIERILMQSKNYRGAIEEYKQIEGGDRSAPVQARLGSLLYSVDPEANMKLAEDHLEKAKKIDAKALEAYRTLTYIYVMSNRGRDAIREGAKALQINKFDAVTYNNLAWLHATSKEEGIYNLKLAEDYAKKAVELTLENSPAYLDTLVEAYYRSGDTDKRNLAQTYLRRAITIVPRDDLEYYMVRFKKLFPKETPPPR